MLANEGGDYVIYCPRQEGIRIRELRAGRRYQCEWFDSLKSKAGDAKVIATDSSTLSLQAPGAVAVLFLELEAVPAVLPLKG